jgi:zinc transport system ATP-binding protein
MTPLIRLRDLRVSLGGNPILRGVNAQIARGQITALVGLNGSGKTTLLRALLHEIPFGGAIEFFCGHDHRHPRPEYIGYVPQRLRIDANLPLTVEDLLALALARRPLFLGVPKKRRGEMIELLAFVGAAPQLLTRQVDKLSGGELQRILLGLACHPNPELLLLDEPAAGIDFKDQEKFYELISRLNRERGVTIVLVSHDIAVVTRHAHQVLCLSDGVIQCQGPPKEMLTGEQLRHTFGTDKGLFHHAH